MIVRESRRERLSSNKQKRLVNPAFMRVFGLLKGLLITN